MKKAIMVDFLTTVLLAIIIFVPTCYALSKVFVLSDQAKNSFVEFAADIQDFAKDENKLKMTGVLILDQETSITLYDQIEAKPTFAEGDNLYYLAYPQNKCQTTPCLCLCRKFELGEEQGSLWFREEVLYPDISKVKDAHQSSCALQECLAFPQLQFKQGFTVFRGENDVRRVVLNIHKEADSNNQVQLVASKP